jgi:hypothetical protein
MMRGAPAVVVGPAPRAVARVGLLRATQASGDAAALLARPLSITDRTCEVLTGFGPRPWRLALVELGVPHCRVGRRTVCAADAWLAAIAHASGAAASTTDGAPAAIQLDAAEFMRRATRKAPSRRKGSQ